jgi:acetyl-CoA carboxylase biotin carboxyl carrier protein
MTFDEIKQLLDVVREHELSEFELERDGFKIRVVKQGSAPVVTMAGLAAPVVAPLPAPLPPPAPAAPVQASAATPAAAPDEEGEVELAVVKSPIVGTFYRSSEPGAPSFVEIGQAVRRNQVLCIIEAMKLMNEITSEYEGELVKCYVENGQPVQYGERLFAIKAK